MVSKPKARVLIYERTTSVGDAVQTVAMARLLGGECAGVYRDAPVPDLYADVPFVVNGWLGWGAPADGKNCFFAGIHLGEHEPAYIRWIRQSPAPAGTRDDYTLGLLTGHRIPSEVVGCPTLTFSPYRGPRSGRYSIDVKPLPDTQFETNLIPAGLSWPEQWELALHRLEQLRRAEIVYTRRVHVILPCLAFGTPVVFPSKEFRGLFDKSRLSILHWLGFPYDEIVQLDVTSIAHRYVQFLARILNTTIDPVERPAMPEPVVAPRDFKPAARPPQKRARAKPPAAEQRYTAPLVSAVVLTKNGAGRLERCLESIRQTNFADEIVVCVDRDTTDSSFEVARSFTPRVHRIPTGGSVESALPRMVSLCSGSFVLRVDDDECIAGNWDKEEFQMLVGFNDFTHVRIPCRWIVPPGNAFIANSPWFPDLKIRLFRNDPDLISWPKEVHDPMMVLGRSIVLFDRWIDHFGLVLNSRRQREQKCSHYLGLRPEYDLSHLYLWEGRDVRLLSCDTSGFQAAASAVRMRLAVSVSPYRPGAEIEFHPYGNSADYQLKGWGVPEAWGTWTIGQEAEILLPLEEPLGGDAILTVEAAPYVNDRHPRMQVEIFYGGDIAGTWSYESADCVRHSLTIPACRIATDTWLLLRFRIVTPASPLELGKSDDSRLLGLGFRSLCLERARGAGSTYTAR